MNIIGRIVVGILAVVVFFLNGKWTARGIKASVTDSQIKTILRLSDFIDFMVGVIMTMVVLW